MGPSASLATALTALVLTVGLPLQSALATSPSPVPTSMPDPTSATDRARAAAAAAGTAAGQAARARQGGTARVEALTAAYSQASRRAQAAAERLAQAFATGAHADELRSAAEAELAKASDARASTVRAVYVDGGPLGVALTVLTAPSAEDALWRMGAAQLVTAGLVQRADEQVSTAAARTARALAIAQLEDDANIRLAAALREVQDAAATAADDLAAARAELAVLSAQQQRADAARVAAEHLAAAEAVAESARLAAARKVSPLDLPPEYEAVYRAAALTCPGMRWTLLAAVGQVESGHGRNNGPSSAGAQGPMQFMPATFALYAVDGNADGVLDVWDYHDAIFSAAHYLCVSGVDQGTGAGVQAALFTYNHAQWYVDLVLSAEQGIIASHP